MSPDLLSNTIFGIFMSCIGLIAIWQARERSPPDDVEMQRTESDAIGRSLDSGQDVRGPIQALPGPPQSNPNWDFTTPDPARNHAAVQPSRANPNLIMPRSELHTARVPNTNARDMNH